MKTQPYTAHTISALAAAFLAMGSAQAEPAAPLTLTAAPNGNVEVRNADSQVVTTFKSNGDVQIPALNPSTGDTQFVCAKTGGTLYGCEAPAAGSGEQGPAGPQGVQGEQGPAGPQGARGEQGPVGSQGARGEQGPVGSQGARGEPGPVGSQGVQGEQGPVGPQGQQGEQGPVGTADASIAFVIYKEGKIARNEGNIELTCPDNHIALNGWATYEKDGGISGNAWTKASYLVLGGDHTSKSKTWHITSDRDGFYGYSYKMYTTCLKVDWLAPIKQN